VEGDIPAVMQTGFDQPMHPSHLKDFGWRSLISGEAGDAILGLVTGFVDLALAQPGELANLDRPQLMATPLNNLRRNDPLRVQRVPGNGLPRQGDFFQGSGGSYDLVFLAVYGSLGHDLLFDDIVYAQHVITAFLPSSPHAPQSFAVYRQHLPFAALLLLAVLLSQTIKPGLIQNAIKYPPDRIMMRHPTPFQLQQLAQLCGMVPGPIGDLSWLVFSTQFRQKNNDQQGHQTVSFAMRMAGVPYLLKAGV